MSDLVPAARKVKRQNGFKFNKLVLNMINFSILNLEFYEQLGFSKAKAIELKNKYLDILTGR
jgi:hypothetical protein